MKIDNRGFEMWELLLALFAVCIVGLAVVGFIASMEEETYFREVVVVAVKCEVRIGSADCVTIVEDADKRRYTRPERWGEEGDTIMIELGGDYPAWRSS